MECWAWVNHGKPHSEASHAGHGPLKDLVAGPEHWIPSETGAYVYLLSNA